MTPGHVDDVRLDARKLAARLDVTPRHLARMVRQGRFPAGHYLGERRRWWMSEVLAWEAATVTAAPPPSLQRGAANLRHGPAPQEAL